MTSNEQTLQDQVNDLGPREALRRLRVGRLVLEAVDPGPEVPTGVLRDGLGTDPWVNISRSIVAPTCGTCRFHEGLECRRYPPQQLLEQTRFPITNHVAWCGEHQPR